MERNYENLAQAIIVLACKDYRRALKKLKKDKWNADAKAIMREVESFFHSYEFSIYTELDPDMLLSRLKMEVQ